MNKQDIRIQKTYKALIDAFLDLQKKQSFNDISINDLCKRSNIGRATFYRHFKNKEDFIKFASEQWVDKYLKTAFENLDYFIPKRLELLNKIVRPMFTFINDNRQSLQSESGFNLSNVFFDTFQSHIQKIIDSYCEMHGVIFNGNSELLSAEIAGGVVYAGNWYKDNIDADLDDTVKSVVVPLDRVLDIYFPNKI
ncbi:TetR/AcrR family transcriptional regulator [Lactobacillus sp. Sy-1]|uniref:TetR/AcrR family transcriptional regulator n=1 Tax=Lactobacillus sp. Sy-1 TaxID=2109645 RepID=UPI001C5A7DC0|nr:TetR/AcrR family transcriptional regulator [Lactobacillus sp. Sy-1]MBW1606036.1 TetR/AcrR family transcriptional regulator [Lactobacillus sp. Sy-1]